MENTPASFDELWKEYGGLIKRVSRAYAVDEDEWQDLIQESSLALWKSMSSFQGKSKLSTWVYRVVMNVCLGHIRKETRKREQQQTFEKEAAPEGSNEKVELLERLYAGLNRLGTADKAVMTLYLEEKNYSEIAEILGISESNVGVRINRAKNKLKTIVNG